MANDQTQPAPPSRRDIDAWRVEAETAIRFGGVGRLGKFDWPRVVLSLIAEWERSNVNGK